MIYGSEAIMISLASMGKCSDAMASRPANISLVSYPRIPSEEPDRLNKTLERMGGYIEQAAHCKSDLIAFPEICNYLGASSGVWDGEPLDGPTVAAISSEAKEHGIYVVCPMVTQHDGKKHNSSILFDRSGEIVGIYHKNFPTHGELNQGIIPGTETPVFETDFGRVGLSICFDLNYWEVGSGLCANKAELVIWSSMWSGERMLTKWAIEFGFYMGACYSGGSSFVDMVGREIINHNRNLYNSTGGSGSTIVSATMDMDRRLLHHDSNVGRLKGVYEKYGSNSIYAEWLGDECLLIIGSQMPGISTDQIIEEFGLEPMRDYLARARRDRKRALQGTYSPDK